MHFESFAQSLSEENPPEGLPPLALALWWDAKGDWARAHQIAQDIDSAAGAWVHAYLHRKEGDSGNAGYWYRQAGKPHPHSSLPVEWAAIARALLGD